MTTYKITNLVPNMEKNEIIAFFEFSNGETFSNKFTLSTTIAKIKQWGQTQCAWFDDREVRMEEMRKQLLEQPIVEVVEEVIEQ